MREKGNAENRWRKRRNTVLTAKRRNIYMYRESAPLNTAVLRLPFIVLNMGEGRNMPLFSEDAWLGSWRGRSNNGKRRRGKSQSGQEFRCAVILW